MRSFKKYYFHFEYRDSNNNNTIFSLTLHSSVCQGLVITQEPFLVSLVVNPSVLVSIHLSVTVSCWPFLCLRHRRWAFPTWGQGHSLSLHYQLYTDSSYVHVPASHSNAFPIPPRTMSSLGTSTSLGIVGGFPSSLGGIVFVAGQRHSFPLGNSSHLHVVAVMCLYRSWHMTMLYCWVVVVCLLGPQSNNVVDGRRTLR